MYRFFQEQMDRMSELFLEYDQTGVEYLWLELSWSYYMVLKFLCILGIILFNRISLLAAATSTEAKILGGSGDGGSF